MRNLSITKSTLVIVTLLFFYPQVRSAEAQSCSQQDINQNIQWLTSENRDVAIKFLGQCGDVVVPELINSLEASNDVSTQISSLDAILSIGADAIPRINLYLRDKRVSVETRIVLIEALTILSQTASKENLEVIVESLKERQQDISEELLVRRQATLALSDVTVSFEPQIPSQIMSWIQKNTATSVGFSLLIAMTVFYLLILLLRPQWLLLLPGKLTIPKTGLSLPSKWILWLKYQPRVLDHWVARELPQYRNSFLFIDTVSDRDIHIPIQIELHDRVIAQLTHEELMPIFNQLSFCLMIHGEGGTGKTSLACQIARWVMYLPRVDEGRSNTQICKHKMLPILIENELEDTDLLYEIRKRLPLSVDGNFISLELLGALLRQRRVLVILDHVSEMGTNTYSKMKKTLNTAPINALIITSRRKEKDLGRPRITFIKPQKISGSMLSTFIPPYLKAQGKRDLFEDDPEFFRTCTRLSSMMAVTLQSATALLVRLYVDQVIEAGGLKTAQLPDNIPDLMLSYIAWLNREEQVGEENRIETLTVQQISKMVAWECLKETYRPSDALCVDILTTLTRFSGDQSHREAMNEAEIRLKYLEEVLRLVQVSPSGQRLRIILDPVAEYLAALHLIDYCQQAENKTKAWEKFLMTVDRMHDLESIRGFLLAVRNCCEQIQKNLPDGTLEELNERASLDPEELEQARRRQRINKLIDDLYDSDPKYLKQAILNLSEEGQYAYRAIHDLEKVLKSKQLSPDLRGEAIAALLKIQNDKKALDTLLRSIVANQNNIDRDDQQVRAKAVDGLLELNYDPDSLKKLLEDHFHDCSEHGLVRVRSGNGLRLLGGIKDLLIVTIADDSENTHSVEVIEAPRVQDFFLKQDTVITMVSISGGSFLMGSPENEGFNDERPQHEATIAPFWMGQVPVTQSQYRAVTGQNPSHFQGNRGLNLAVDTISWHDAVKFCQLLTQYILETSLRYPQQHCKGRFRLPTEAEWEYACRAGTTTPFYFGATITTDLANYRAIDWNYSGQIYPGSYGKGPKGVFREKSMDVKSFPPNKFGLHDMHGGVWEWCQDQWHDTYDGAPSDGSPWLTEESGSYRVLRGGSWVNPPNECRSAFRLKLPSMNRDRDAGFRVVWVPVMD